ncbi:uncharacterized protein N7459_004496 [Penicillium hispanicum]|uniref:uncharacterized protein n=1 Tax=Penicillium hispanicum TaxID=1080232 RepID=UPI00253FEEF9|nr:uncharacterized protein N7459_004496 [Penicillium hispanicum]KAJ5584696.1 hypothetical protein N7459_004496 [Penicillium hispanicum]
MPLASSHPPALSVEDQIARMPVGRPLSGAILTRNGYFFNRDEVLAHVYFGAQKKYIGAVRLCGQTLVAKMNLLATKGPGQTFEMWFQHTFWCNAWMEGFSDTNEELFTMAESLRVQNRIAVYYPEDPTGNTWLAYSTRSPQFEFLDKMNLEIPGGVPIRLAVRNPLPPVPVLTAQAIARSIAPPSTDQQPRPSAHSDFQHVQRSSEPDPRLHSQRARLINTTGSDNLANSGRHTNVQELRDQQTQLFKDQDPAHIAPAKKSSHQTEMATSLPGENFFPSADPRLRRPTSSSSGVALSHKETPLHEQDVSQNVLQNDGPESISNFTEDTSTGVDYGSSPVEMALDEPNTVERPANLTGGQSVQIKEPALAVDTLLDFFKSNLRITFQELATLQDSSTAGIFYLHFPNSSETPDPEFQLLDHWLNHHSVIVLSNRNPSDWEKFRKNSKNGGVAIFHESFHGFDTLRPRIWEALWYPTNFWTIRISNPLEFPDLRYCEPGVHFQRLFSYGGAFLLTEDVFHDLQRAAIIFCWFSSYQKSAPGANKLVFRPDLLQYLSQRLADPKREVENDGLFTLTIHKSSLITIIAWIKKINSVDSAHPYFDSKSLDPRYLDQANNNVLCLPIPGYGTRSETQSPDIPKGLTQEERNVDHLVETFSGWAISNATRLRRSVVVTNCKNPSMLARWKNWGHVSVLQVSDFMRSWKINEALYLEKLQYGNMSSQSGGPNSPLVTPHTPRPRTPRTPRESQDSRDHRSHGDRRHASTGDSHPSWNGNWRAPDKIQYPAGYK